MKNKNLVLILMLFAGFALSNKVNAAVTYSLTFDQQTYVVQSGQVFDVELFLLETFDGDSGTGTTRFVGGAGMISGSVQATLTGSGSTVFSANPTFGPGFDDAFNIAGHTSTTASLDQLVDVFSPRIPGNVSGNVTRVSLGRFFLTAGGAGSVNQLTPDDLTAFDDLGIEDDAFNLFVIDSDPSFSSLPSTITAIPEPGSCLALAAVAGLVLARHRRRNQK